MLEYWFANPYTDTYGQRDRYMDWRADANCRDSDPELFFPAGAGRAVEEQVTEAKIICMSCVVVEHCLQEGLSAEHGIWAGLTEQERKKVRRSLARKRPANR